MYLILSTPLTIYLFDLLKGKLTPVAAGEGEYSGISWDDSSIYISHSNIDNTSLKTEQDYRNSNKAYIKSYSPNGEYIAANNLSMPHQILRDSRGRLLVTNTGHNCIKVRELADGKEYVCRLNEIDCEVIGDKKVGNHFNSLYEHDGSLFVVAHNNNRNSSVWELDMNSLDVIKTYDTKAEWAHNVWICEHGMIICNSKSGSLYDVYSGETIWAADEPRVITRGLAANEDYIFVGRSEYGNRFSRKWSDGGFWILDRKTLKTVETVKLHRTGCINELRLFNSEDECHKAPLLNTEMIKYFTRVPVFNKIRRIYGYLDYRARNTIQNPAKKNKRK